MSRLFGLSPVKGPFKAGKLANSLPSGINIRCLAGVFERRGDPLFDTKTFNQREHHARLLEREPFHSDNFKDFSKPRFDGDHHGTIYTSEPSQPTHQGRETRDRLKCLAIGLHHTLLAIAKLEDKDIVA